jgi:hypothetical protein
MNIKPFQLKTKSTAMLQSTPKKKIFSAPDYKTPDELWLTEPDTLRRLVGILGVLLPIMLPFFLWIDTGRTAPLESISHYHFTRVCAIFITVISLLAIFLLIYKGQTPREFWLSALAGIGALLLLMFPTDNIVKGVFLKIGRLEPVNDLAKACDGCINSPESAYTATFLNESIFRKQFHFYASALFLVSLILLIVFVFIYTKKQIKAVGAHTAAARRMKQRNVIYGVCASLMFLAVLFIAFGDLIVGEVTYKLNHLTFWMETIAVESFGLSWLLRGDMLLPDKGNVRAG